MEIHPATSGSTEVDRSSPGNSLPARLGAASTLASISRIYTRLPDSAHKFRPRMLRFRGYGDARMAAGSSRFQSISRGATTGQGAKVRREGLAPLPSLEVYVPTIDSLEEISG